MVHLNIPWLDQNEIWFPKTSQALLTPNGLLAAGGTLSLERLLTAYRAGIFPWFSEHQPLLWWSPDPRAILYLDDIKISRSLRKTLRSQKFELSFDHAFEEVVNACALPRQKEKETWITDEMKEAYVALHRAGFAHSIEVWLNQGLVGGLYGVSLGGVFFGESMFSHVRDASKVALVYLAGQLSEWQFTFIDCQVPNPHLEKMGSVEIARPEFEKLLSSGLKQADIPQKWDLTWQYLD